MRIGTITSHMIPHQSRRYMINLLVVLAPKVVHIPLPLTRFSPSSCSFEVIESLFRILASAETSTVFPIALGNDALFSSNSDYLYSPGLRILSLISEPNNSGANSWFIFRKTSSSVAMETP